MSEIEQTSPLPAIHPHHVNLVAPAPLPRRNLDLFLAGGITGTDDWQARVGQELTDLDIMVANPRRAEGLSKTGSGASEQIAWEHAMLMRATTVLFWFAPIQLQPIALFELGAMSHLGKNIIVGADPEYPRRFDVVEQMSNIRPNLPIHESLDDLIRATRQAMAHQISVRNQVKALGEQLDRWA